MKPRIYFQKIWFDNDLIEFKVEVTDGDSLFSNKVYIGYRQLENLLNDLNVFREHIHGGIYDIELGNFGPEYGSGGFQARLHFYSSSKLYIWHIRLTPVFRREPEIHSRRSTGVKRISLLYISTHQQSDYRDFTKYQVASEAKLYLKTEPGLLDNFISELKSLSLGNREDSTLECI